MLSPAHHLDDATVGTTVARAAARVGDAAVLAPVALAPCTDARRVRHAHAGAVVGALPRTSAPKAVATKVPSSKQMQVRSEVPSIDATPWLMGTFRTYHPTWRLRLHAP
jgi:hypothetical protein